MSITVEWDNEEKSIVRYTFLKGWRLSEADEALNKGKELLMAVPHTVDIIMDFHSTPLFAPSGSLSFGVRIMRNDAPSNAGITVVVGSRFVNNMLNIVQNIIRDTDWKTMAAKDVLDAREKLRAKQESRKQLL